MKDIVVLIGSKLTPRVKSKKWLALPVVFFIFLLLDRVFPLALPNQDSMYAQVVVDESGVPLRAFPDNKGVWRYQTSLDQISPFYIEALLTYEDRRFWYHPGIDPLAIARAIIGNTVNGRAISGSSTITMQVGRLLHPHSKTLHGKLHQAFRALQLEWHLSKKEILTLYCNIAPFGGTIEGVQAASYTYLNKPAKELSRAEAALLAVLPQSPTRFRPDLHPNKAQQARNKVLNRMVTLKQWSKEDVAQAKIEDVYAIHSTIEQHAPLLARRLAKQSQEKVIHTYIDRNLQIALEDYIQDYISQQANNTSAAVLVAENKTGKVKAYVGTAVFGDPQRFGHVDMVTAIRSPGSTLKPFLYALALDEGLIHSQSLLSDAPMHWGDYQPGNFNGGFSGPVSATDALQRSLNIPAVTLLDHIGAHRFSDRLKNAGLHLKTPNNEPSLAIILGGTGTTLESLVAAYTAFANQGKTKALQITTHKNQPAEKFFFSKEAAWIVQNMLTGVSRPNSIRHPANMSTRQNLAWKTGTSFGARDAWAIGLNAKYTIGVWLGRPDNSAVPGNGGRVSAGPLLHAVADHLPLPSSRINKPTTVTRQTICWPLGTSVKHQHDNHCHKKMNAWTINDIVPPTLSDPRLALSQNPITLAANTHATTDTCLTNKNKEAASIALWPTSVTPWLRPTWRMQDQFKKAFEHCKILNRTHADLKIEGLQNNNKYRPAQSDRKTLKIQLSASGGHNHHHWFINGKYHKTTAIDQFTNINLVKKGKIQIVVSDDLGNTDKVEISVQ